MATRNERVVLTLQDDFTTGMARAAAATARFNRELEKINGVTVRVDRGLKQVASQDVPLLERNVARAGSQIDRMSGRLRILADVAAVLGPGLIPLSGVAAAGIGGLANQLGVAALAGGTAIIAFQGVGEALEAMNKAQLEPTEANLEKANLAMGKLDPTARQLVRQLQSLTGSWADLKRTAAGALLPSVGEAIDELMQRLPDVERIVENLNGAMGNLLVEGAEALNQDEWDEFFDFLATDARDTLVSLGITVGNLTQGFAELWMAFDPLSDGFSSWMVDAARDFNIWAQGLSQAEGFQEFIAYVRDTGPQVADTLGALAMAVLDIVQAAAPLGGPVLQALEAIARTVSVIADSDLGTPIFGMLAAMALLNRTQATFNTLTATGFGAKAKGNILGAAQALGTYTSAADRARMSASQLDAAMDKQAKNAGALRRTAAAVAGVGFVASGAAEGLGVANTATLALTGGLLGGAPGAAAGGLIGAVQDLTAATNLSDDALRRYIETTLAAAGPSAKEQIAAIDAQIAAMERLDAASTADDNFLQRAIRLPDWMNSNDAEQKLDTLKRTRAELAHQAELEAIATGKATTATDEGGLAAVRAAARQQRLKQQMEQLTQQADATSDQFIGFSETLDDNKVSLREWIREMEKNADALRNFRTNAEQAARRGLDEGLIRALEEMGPAGARRMRQLADATDAEIARASTAWRRGQREAKRYEEYVRDVANMPPIVTKVEADTRAARAGIDRFIEYANGRRITIFADGSFSTGEGNKGMADGGWTGPGGKYEPAGVVHRDEFVFSKEATQGNVPYLESLHRSLRGFAGGGYTGAPDTVTRPQSVMNWSTVNNYAPAAAPSGRQAPLVAIGTVRHNDMRETERHAREMAALVDGGGVQF